MSRALIIAGGLVAQIAAAGTLQADNLDAITAGPLVLGGGQATSISLGTNAVCTAASLATGANIATLNVGTGAAAKTIQIGQGGGTPDTIEIGTPAGAGATIHLNGNVTVRGTEDVVGNTTFAEDVTLGDATNDAILIKGTLTFDGGTPGYVGGDIPFNGGSKTISILNGAVVANLTLKAANNSAGAGGNLYLTTGTGSLATNTGSIIFGPNNVVDDTAYQLLCNGTDATPAGIRYANAAGTNKWQVRSDGLGWVDIATGLSLPNGTVTGDILQWTGAAWTNTTFATLNNAASINISHAAGNTQYAITLHGQDGVAGAGGATTVRGGNGTTNTAGGAVVIQGGGSVTGAAGLLTLAGGAASGAGTGGDIYINGGSHVGGTHGNIYIAQDALGIAYFGAGVNGVKYTGATGVLTAIGTGSIDLGVNATRRWSIDGVLVGATGQAAITAANFDKLFDGSAVTTHTHAGLSSSDVTVSATTDGGALNDVVYLTAADAMAAARANNATTSKAMGVRTAASKVMLTGVATCTMEGALVAVVGNDLWLSSATAGRVTNVAPSAAGEFLVYIGQAKTAGASPTVYLRPERPLAL